MVYAPRKAPSLLQNIGYSHSKLSPLGREQVFATP